MSTLKVNAITDAAGGNTATINSMTPTADSLQGFRNRIINGDMRIDQRNAGASVTNTAGEVYAVDRFPAYGSQASKFTIQRNAGSVTPPAGFTNYVGVTSLSAYSVLAADEFVLTQKIEGLNVSDLGFGTASAKTVTVSFWVRSSLTGSFGGNIANSALNRAYPFTYTISSANTWEYKTVTIAGDTTGTWLTTNGIGLYVRFGLGVGSTYGSGTAGAWTSTYSDVPSGSVSVVGTNGATWYITGVQLEVGSVATPFERRPYGTELALCQRYLPVINAATYWVGSTASTTLTVFDFPWQVQPRVAPTGITIPALANFALSNYAGNTGTPTAVSFSNASLNHGRISSTTTAGSPTIAGGNTCELQVGGSGYIQFTGCEL